MNLEFQGCVRTRPADDGVDAGTFLEPTPERSIVSHPYPLTPIQEGMLYHHLAGETGPGGSRQDVDVEQIVCSLRESVDVALLQEAWNSAFRDIPRLGTSLRWEGVPNPEQRDGSGPAPEIKVREDVDSLATFLDEDRRRSFDLSRAPLSRLTLLRLRPEEEHLVWTFPHILMDGRSFAVVLQRVFDAYEALRADSPAEPPPPPPPPFRNFVEWLDSRDRTAEEPTWRQYLEGFASPTPLPFHGLPGRSEGRRHAEVSLGAEDSTRLRTLGEDGSLTLHTIVQGAWGLLLARHAGAEEAVFGATRSGRNRSVERVDEMVGVLINTTPVRVRIPTDPTTSVRDWLRTLRSVQGKLRVVEHAPLVQIQQWSAVPAGRPLFESLVVFDHARLDAVMASGPDGSRSFRLYERTPYPLTLYAYGEAELRLELAWDRDRISDAGAKEILEQLVDILRAFGANPEVAVAELAMPFLDALDRERGWNRTERPFPAHATLHGLVSDALRIDRDRVVLRSSDGQALRARELEELSNRIARYLRSQGADQGTLVGVALPRSAEMVAALLGILKAGAAYLPLDPAYPSDRLAFMLADSGASILLSSTEAVGSLAETSATTVLLDRDRQAILSEPPEALDEVSGPEDLAYVMYTSGSTGRPKGVQVEHRNVVNFLCGMDDALGVPDEGEGAWLSLTSLSFDISVLEIFWPLSRGVTLVMYREPHGEGGGRPGPFLRAADSAVGVQADSSAGSNSEPEVAEAQAPTSKGMAFSLFYFASDSEAAADLGADPPAAAGSPPNRYRLLLEGARFADAHGFSAVWTPERHFHAFGGLYPNPSVTGAAIAAITSRIGIRAGSVVLPLHHPIRVAEEWSVVDNLSGGRVGLSLAAGWHPNDFVLRPDRHADRKEILVRDTEVLRRLWKGERLPFPGPDGTDVDVEIHPRPVQPELPIWITTAGSPETWILAGRMGANVLTHLLGQTPEDLSSRIRAYRAAWVEAGHAGDGGTVSLMLHTFVGPDTDAVRELVREPMKAYLRSSVSLIRNFAEAWTAYRKTEGSAAAEASKDSRRADDFESLSDEDLDALLDFSFERYFETSGLFGSPERCVEMASGLRSVGVDEIACLVDFGVDSDRVLEHLPFLAQVRSAMNEGRPSEALEESPEFADQVQAYGVTHVQCTPSRLRMLLADSAARTALRGLSHFLVGGEALPGPLAQELRGLTGGRVLNMYGPTETTIWSSVHEIRDEDTVGTVPIGRPIANTSLHVLDASYRPLPPGIPGELFIGGSGVVRGYLGRPELTAERFLPDPFALPPLDKRPPRMYRTGDLVRRRPDGVLDFLGRSDHQIKLRGHRIELGEIESALQEHPGVADAAVVLREEDPGDARLVAYVTPSSGGTRGKTDTDGTDGPLPDALRAHLLERLPAIMAPAEYVLLDALPLTPNRKVDRAALPDPKSVRRSPEKPPRTHVNGNGPVPAHVTQGIREIWQELLGKNQVEIDDNFFDLGGHSLLTVRVQSRLRERFGVDLRITDLFRYPTVRSLAGHLGGSVGAPGAPETSPVAGAHDRAALRRSALRRRTPNGAGT